MESPQSSDDDLILLSENKFLIIGAGAREMAIMRNLKKTHVNTVYGYLPYKHAALTKHLDGYFIYEELNYKACYEYCIKNYISYVIICSENFMKDGLVDYLEATNLITCIAPSKYGAQIETSKGFARNMLNRNHKLFNPAYLVVTSETAFSLVLEFIKRYKNQVVVKADGLHSGKGVKVYDKHMFSLEDVINTIYAIINTGEDVVLEEKICSDKEFSFITFTDGVTCAHTYPIRDFKTLHENNSGPNTGSMGCLTERGSLHYVTRDHIRQAEMINSNIINQINHDYEKQVREGLPRNKTRNPAFKGILYGSYIIDTENSLKVIEFNCRMGDPEGVLMLHWFPFDFGVICRHIDKRSLHYINSVKEPFSKKLIQSLPPYAMCKYIVPEGYPDKSPASLFTLTENILTSDSLYVGGLSTVDVLKENSLQNAPDKVSKIQQHKTTGSRIALVISSGTNSLQEVEMELREKIEMLISLVKPKNQKVYWRNNFNRDYYRGAGLGAGLGAGGLGAGGGGISYESAGVDINKGNQCVSTIKTMVEQTYDMNVFRNYGGFGGVYNIEFTRAACREPLLVTSMDGVGTKSIFTINHFKLKGFEMLGEDLVNHCVNDILVQGATPLFFTDYFASSKLNVDEFASFIRGVCKACKENDCSLVGGETAEMPNVYMTNQHDFVGSIVGLVDQNELINGKTTIETDDVLIGFPSSGPHTNGFSLIRKLEKEKPECFTNDLIKQLATPHKSYMKEYRKIQELNINVKGMAHITGGGFRENIRRVVPDNLEIILYEFAYSSVFKQLQEIANMERNEMERVFNCGIGMVFIVNPKDGEKLLKVFRQAQYIGHIV